MRRVESLREMRVSERALALAVCETGIRKKLVPLPDGGRRLRSNVLLMLPYFTSQLGRG